MAAWMLMPRLALCETDHASLTGDNRGCVLCVSDGAETSRESSIITPSVVATNLLIRWRNLGCAENNESALICNAYKRIITRNSVGRHISEQGATVPFVRQSKSFFVFIATGRNVRNNQVKFGEDNNEGH